MKWFANRYICETPKGIILEVEFNRTTGGDEGWEWSAMDDAGSISTRGREVTLEKAKRAALKAAKRKP